MLHVINSAVKKEIETYHSFRIYLFKVNSKNITASSNLFKVRWRCSGFLIVNFEHISCHVLVILLLTLKRWITAETVITSQLKVLSCKMRNYWKIIAYVYEMYPESFSAFQLFIILQLFTCEMCHFLCNISLKKHIYFVWIWVQPYCC